jgi:hypothetical protein
VGLVDGRLAARSGADNSFPTSLAHVCFSMGDAVGTNPLHNALPTVGFDSVSLQRVAAGLSTHVFRFQSEYWTPN